MAHGKSLELQKFDEEMGIRGNQRRKPAEARQALLCSCGQPWGDIGGTHFTKAGKLRKPIAGDRNHIPTGRQGMLIKAIAANQAGWKAPKKKAS